MNDKELIKRLGGVNAIADFLKFERTRVHNWVHRGIPSKVKVKYPQYFMTDRPKSLASEHPE